MKPRGQVTIPAAVRRKIAAAENDVFDVAVVDGAIVLRPQEVVARGASRPSPDSKRVDIRGWIGSGNGLFETPEEVDAFIRGERAQWD